MKQLKKQNKVDIMKGKKEANQQKEHKTTVCYKTAI